MELKYPENLKFKIVQLDGIQHKWKFAKAGSCLNDCEKMDELKIGDEAILKHKKNPAERYQYYLVFDSGLDSDYMSEREIEIMMGQEFIESLQNKYIHIKQPKPPLGVMPIDIYELKRVQDLCRALYEYSRYEGTEIEDMIKWSEELNDRLYSLKGLDVEN